MIDYFARQAKLLTLSRILYLCPVCIRIELFFAFFLLVFLF